VSGKSKFDGFPELVTDSDWIRMAAFLDGEGCIRIEKVEPTNRKNALSPFHNLILVMGNTDPRLPLWCKKKFGGNLYHRESSKRNSRHRDAYVWHAGSNRAECILRGCLPYFLLKREQAEVALAFFSIANTQLKGEQVPESIVVQRETYRKQLSELKTQKFEVIEGFRTSA